MEMLMLGLSLGLSLNIIDMMATMNISWCVEWIYMYNGYDWSMDGLLMHTSPFLFMTKKGKKNWCVLHAKYKMVSKNCVTLNGIKRMH